MSAGNPENFPWGLNTPTRSRRVPLAILIGLLSSLGLLLKLRYRPGEHVDFDLIWMGSRIFWSGADPYQMIGPAGVIYWNFPMLYPATALVAALPLVVADACGGSGCGSLPALLRMLYGLRETTSGIGSSRRINVAEGSYRCRHRCNRSRRLCVYHEALDRLPEGALTMTILWLIVIATTYLPCAIAILRRPNIPGADFFRSRVTP